MANERPVILDKNHGFMKFIIKNQIERDNFDREEKLRLYKRSSVLEEAENELEVESFENDRKTTTTDTKIETNCNRISFENVKESVRIENSNQFQNVPEKNTDDTMFKLEFLSKSGNSYNINVCSKDSVDTITNKLTEKYPLDMEKRQALIRRLGKEMKRFRSHGS